MTLDAMQDHEAVTLHHAATDYRRQGVLQLVREYIVGDDLLDMRCLEGTLAVEQAKQGRRVVALDGFSGAVEITNQLASEQGVDQELAHLWNLSGLKEHRQGRTFDCVVCLDLLNHVEDDRVTLQEIAEVVKPGGRLIVLAPAFQMLLGKRDESLGHLRRYSRSQLTELLREFGFEAGYARYWNFLALPAYIFIEVLLRARINDPVRYAGADRKRSILGPVLRFWYTRVERWIVPPVGLSVFVVAHKTVEAE